MGSEPVIFFLLLLIGTLVLYVLPFIPAIVEWKYKIDALPSRVNFLDKTIVEYCISTFKNYIDRNFAAHINEYRNTHATHEGKSRNGREYIISSQQGLVQLSNKELTAKKSKKDIILCQSAALPQDIHFENRIYGLESIDIGSMSVVNELLAEKNIILNAGVRVNTLIYGGDTITVRGHCILNKYTKAKTKIHFLEQAEFQYLHAPLIEFGKTDVKLPDTTVDVISTKTPRDIILGKLDIPENSYLNKHLVVKGSLVIHSGSEIKGNIKCYEDMLIEKNTKILGAIVCNADIIIADNCIIQGPIVSSGTIRIGNNCVIGTRDAMTSLVAENLVISNGCLISGLVLAKVKGIFQTSSG